MLLLTAPSGLSVTAAQEKTTQAKRFKPEVIAEIENSDFNPSVMAVDGRSNREEELAAELPSCVEESVNTLLAAKQYDINNRNEFVADLAENLSVLLDSDGDITVEVEQADEARGALSVRVTAEYTHPNGKRGQVSTQRTVLLNKVE